MTETLTTNGETPAEWMERLGMDGHKWAAEFRKTALSLGYADMDEGWLIGWFCNAIMAGFDEASRRGCAELAASQERERALARERDEARDALRDLLWSMEPEQYRTRKAARQRANDLLNAAVPRDPPAPSAAHPDRSAPHRRSDRELLKRAKRPANQ